MKEEDKIDRLKKSKFGIYKFLLNTWNYNTNRNKM